MGTMGRKEEKVAGSKCCVSTGEVYNSCASSYCSRSKATTVRIGASCSPLFISSLSSLSSLSSFSFPQFPQFPRSSFLIFKAPFPFPPLQLILALSIFSQVARLRLSFLLASDREQGSRIAVQDPVIQSKRATRARIYINIYIYIYTYTNILSTSSVLCTRTPYVSNSLSLHRNSLGQLIHTHQSARRTLYGVCGVTVSAQVGMSLLRRR